MTVSDFNPQNKINIHESVLILKTEEVDKQMREKRQISLLEFQATNGDGKRANTRNKCCRQNVPVEAKGNRENVKRNRMCTVSPNILINYEGKGGTLQQRNLTNLTK